MKDGSRVKGTFVSCYTCNSCRPKSFFLHTLTYRTVCNTFLKQQASDILILIDEIFKNFMFMPSNQTGCCALSAQKHCKSKQRSMGYRVWPHAAVWLAFLFCLGVESHSIKGAPFTNKTVSHIQLLPRS